MDVKDTLLAVSGLLGGGGGGGGGSPATLGELTVNNLRTGTNTQKRYIIYGIYNEETGTMTLKSTFAEQSNYKVVCPKGTDNVSAMVLIRVASSSVPAPVISGDGIASTEAIPSSGTDGAGVLVHLSGGRTSWLVKVQSA